MKICDCGDHTENPSGICDTCSMFLTDKVFEARDKKMVTEELTMKQLTDNFKSAILIDNEKKNVWIIKENKVKVYPKQYYEQLVGGLNLFDFTDDIK